MDLNESELRDALNRYRRGPVLLNEPAQRAIQELDAFLGSEVGKLAVQLFEASGSKGVRLYVPPTEDSHYVAFLINGQGLVIESGSKKTVSQDPPDRHFRQTTPKDFIEVIASRHPNHDYSALMRMIEAGVQGVVAKAPKLFTGCNSQP